MKHLLPILTAALAFTTTTASAAYYYDYYLDPPRSNPVPNSAEAINGKTYTNERDSFTYGTMDNVAGNNGSNDFTVSRELNWGNTFEDAGANNSYFRIEVSADNKEYMNLYLTDFVKGVYPTDPYRSTSNALFNMGIREYGYRTLTYDENSKKYVAGDLETKQVLVEDSDGLIVDSEGNHYSLSGNVAEIDSITYSDYQGPVIRYKYELGSFKPGTVIELYMKDDQGREVYSFSNPVGDEYIPFDNASPELDSEGKQPLTAQGGFEDGGYRVPAIQTDSMLDAYYFEQNSPSTAKGDYHDYKPFDEDKTLAADKAMPLSQLIPGGIADAAVAFGIYGMASGIIYDPTKDINGNGNGFGQPLPGGVQLALIAGLFGLGFCYIRRRKVIVS